jgi:hypothetical protein
MGTGRPGLGLLESKGPPREARRALPDLSLIQLFDDRRFRPCGDVVGHEHAHVVEAGL